MNWNYKLIYKTNEDFNKDLNSLVVDALEIKKLAGKLNEKTYFKEYLKEEKKLELKLEKVAIYANLNYSKDSKDIKNQEMYSNTHKIFNDVFSILSFAEPELISLGEDKVNQFLDNDKDLIAYHYYFDKLFKARQHVLEAKIENILGEYSGVLRNFNQMHDILAVADNREREVILSNGDKILVSEANFRNYLETLPKQEDRRKVFESVFKFYADHKSTFASIYNGIMQSELVNMKLRHYNSILESHLDINNINKEVFLTLINTTRENTKDVKKYYELRKKYFNLKEIHTYDRFLNFAESDKTYNYNEAKKLFFNAVKKIGGEFEHKAHEVLAEGRVDVLPQPGKRTGAFSTGSYEKGTFIMLNHTGNLDSVFTLAHEAGHSIHTMFSNEYQPYETSNYVIFVAEIASTFNESLLLDYLMGEDLDRNTKICLLQQEIDNILSTFYRQALFANFEYEAHKLVEEGKPVTYAALSQIMKDLYLDYYNIDLNNEPYKEYVWAYIPHLFNTPFYVYQYATSYAASQAIYQRVKNKDKEALNAYLNLLKSGGSDYPLNLVKKSGVDLTKRETFMAVINRLHELVSELEDILGDVDA